MNMNATDSTDFPLAEQATSICVLGGGVIGLTTAHLLRQEGYRVTIVCGQHWSETTSSVCAALWRPFSVGKYSRHWGSATYHYFRSLARLADTGVAITPTIEYLDLETPEEVEAEIESLWWRRLPGVDFRQLDSDELPEEIDFGEGIGPIRFRAGYAFQTPIIRIPDYLAWLEKQFRSAGGLMEVGVWIRDLSQLCTDSFGAVINCSGYAAPRVVREREPNEKVEAWSGQILRVSGRSPEKMTLIHTGHFAREPLYIVPRTGSVRDVVLGGTVVPVDPPTDKYSLPLPSPEISRRILRRCQAIEPSLRDISLERAHDAPQAAVGLRPWRESVRVELDDSYAKPVIHHYGHGGAGVTLSWGSSLQVAALLAEHLP